MSRIHLLFYIILFIAVTSCTKEDTETRLPEFDAPKLTGFILKTDFGEIYKTIGVPNIKWGNESNDRNSPYYFSIYPNPCFDLLFVHFKTPAEGELKKIWIVQANVENQVAGAFIGINNANNIVVGGSPLFQAETTSNSIHLNLTLLPEGYYRIYIKVGEHLLYDNLIIYRSK